MDMQLMQLFDHQGQITEVVETNRKTEQFGLTLTEEQAELIVSERKNVLREQRRVEFGKSVTPQLIQEFCDSPYIDQQYYAETIIRLQEIFFLFKNEMQDRMTDSELLHLMREQFDELCFGDPDYLESTCLEQFAEGVRSGYDEHKASDGHEVYSRFDSVKRWDYDLYFHALKELCWR